MGEEPLQTPYEQFTHQPEEAMILANHGATDKHAQERKWQHAQRQANRDG